MNPRKAICLTATLLLASSERALAFVPPSSTSASCSPPLTPAPCSLPLSNTRLPLRRGTYLNVLSVHGGDRPLLQHFPVASSASTISGVGDTGGAGEVLSSVTSVLAASFVIAAAIFLYANVVYTPEIIENARAMRQEEQTEQILELVKQLQRERGVEGVRDIDSRDALEKVFGMSVEKYIEGIDADSVSEAEKELVTLLRSIYV